MWTARTQSTRRHHGSVESVQVVVKRAQVMITSPINRRERERERERETHRYKHTDTHTHRCKHTHIDTHGHTDANTQVADLFSSLFKRDGAIQAAGLERSKPAVVLMKPRQRNELNQRTSSTPKLEPSPCQRHGKTHLQNVQHLCHLGKEEHLKARHKNKASKTKQERARV